MNLSHWSIGIDMTEIQRFRTYSQLNHPHFYQRVFDEYEISYCNNFSDPYPHFAGIFAAKEAVFKAVFKFIPLSLSHIFIHHDETGRPIVCLEKKEIISQIGDNWLKKVESLEAQVSITHSSNLALAWALVFVNTSRNEILEGFNRIKAELQREIGNEFVELRSTS